MYIVPMMTPLEIRIELIRRGINYADIARKVGCDRQLVRYALAAKGRGAKVKEIRQVIANILRLKENQIWPNPRTDKTRHRKAA